MTALAIMFAPLQSAGAATASGNLNVQATVSDACSVTDATIDFGAVNPTAGVLIPATGLVNVTCSLGTSFDVGLGEGQNATGGRRRMRRGASSDYLAYELYKDLLLTSRFGDAAAGDRATGLLGLGLLPTVVTVYASVDSGQSAGPGAYSDTVQITVYF